MLWYKKDITDTSEYIRVLTKEEQGLLLGLTFIEKLEFLYTDIIKALIHKKGFYIVKNFPSNQSGYSLDFLKHLILAFGSNLGSALPQNKNQDLIFEVKPEANISLATYNSRGPQFKEALSMHTDAGAMLVMYCLASANTGGHTLLTSAQAVYNEMKHNHPEELDILLNTPFYIDRRGQERNGALPYDVHPIFVFKKDEVFCQYHSTFITDAQKKFPDIPRLDNNCLNALRVFDTIAIRKDLAFQISLDPGDVIFINNEKILHGRTAFDSNATISSRHFLRLWFNSPYISHQFSHFLGY